MKKVINGRRYDTDSAKKVAFNQYSYPSDFHWWRETLYRKNTGEYFLHGEGGPLSRYAETTGQNQWESGEKISPLSVETAQKWAEECLDADEYEKIFGEVEEDDTKKVVTFSLPVSVIEKIKQEAGKAGISLSEYVAECIRRA